MMKGKSFIIKLETKIQVNKRGVKMKPLSRESSSDRSNHK